MKIATSEVKVSIKLVSELNMVTLTYSRCPTANGFLLDVDSS